MIMHFVKLLLAVGPFICLAGDMARSTRVVATVNGRSITAEQLDAATREQLAELEDQARRLRLTVLSKLIDNALIEQAARDASMTVEEYLRRHVESVSVPDAEVDQAYRRNLDQFGGVLAPEAKYRIRRSMEDARRSDALRSRLQTLRQNARISNELVDSQYSNIESGDSAAALGPEDAPVRIVEFSDFECPFCRDLQPVLRRVMARWPGKIRLIYRHLPLERHANAFGAAKAAVCAGRQGKFWPFLEQAFAESSDLSHLGLDRISGMLKVDVTEFAACLASKDTEDQVRQDMTAARNAGVNGTPALFVNKRPIADLSALERVIENEFQALRQAATR